jgi:hypothetical protein
MIYPIITANSITQTGRVALKLPTKKILFEDMLPIYGRNLNPTTLVTVVVVVEQQPGQHHRRQHRTHLMGLNRHC